MCIVFSTCALHSVSSHLFLGKNMNDSLTGSKGGGGMQPTLKLLMTYSNLNL